MTLKKQYYININLYQWINELDLPNPNSNSNTPPFPLPAI